MKPRDADRPWQGCLLCVCDVLPFVDFFSFLFRLAFEDCQADFARCLSPSPSPSPSTELLWEAILFPVSWVPHASPSQPETFKSQIATVDLLLISTRYIPRIEAKGKRRTVNGKARQVARSLRNLPRLCDYYLLASQSDEEANSFALSVPPSVFYSSLCRK